MNLLLDIVFNVFFYLNVSCILRTVGVKSALLQSMVIESPIASQINAET